MALITVEEASDHLRLDLVEEGGLPDPITDERLADLQLKMTQAEAAVLDYIEKEEADLLVSGINPAWEPIIKAAILLLLTALWDDRDGNKEGDYFADNGAIARLLKRIRYPAIA